MQLKKLLISAVIASFTLCSFVPTPCIYAATITSLASTQDIPKNMQIRSFTEFRSIINHAYDTLQTTLVLNVHSNDLSTYKSIIKENHGIASFSLDCLSSGKKHTLTISLTYKQAYKINQGLKNNTAYSRLTAADIQVLNVGRSIVKKITNPSMTDFQKEIAIHDYIVNTTTYDVANAEANTLPRSRYTASGVLIDHVAVCEGYCEAFKLLLNLCNIKCDIVYGLSSDTPHAWNIVNLEGNWYMVDVTFDDPISLTSENARKDALTYDYLNITNSQLRKDHTWDENAYPKATNTKYNYYTYYCLVANNYEEFKSVLARQFLSGQETAICYVTNFNEYTYDLSFIHEFSSNGFAYTIPVGKQGCVTIHLQ